MSPSSACSSLSACGIEGVEEALHAGGVDQQRGQARGRRTPCGWPELAGGGAALEHLLDQATGAQNHLVEVEPGQLGEVHELGLDDPGDPRHLLFAHADVHAPDEIDEQRARGSFVRAHSASPSARQATILARTISRKSASLES